MTTEKAAGASPRAFDPAAWRNLAYATMSMALGFAAWGLISAFAPTFRAQFNLSAQSTAFLVAVPVLLGSLARLPIGMLTDRIGGRVVFTGLFLFVAGAAALGTARGNLRQPARFGLPARRCRGIVCRRRRIRFEMVPAGIAGHRTRHLRARQHGAFGRGVSRSGRGSLVRPGRGVSRRLHPLCCLGRVLLHIRSRRSRDRSPVVNRRDDPRPYDRAPRLGTGGILFPDLRWICRLLRVPAHIVAR